MSSEPRQLNQDPFHQKGVSSLNDRQRNDVEPPEEISVAFGGLFWTWRHFSLLELISMCKKKVVEESIWAPFNISMVHPFFEGSKEITSQKKK